MVREKEDGKGYSPNSPKEWLDRLLSISHYDRDSFIMDTIRNVDQNTKTNILLYCAVENPEVFLVLSMHLRRNHILDGMINNQEAAFERLNIDPNTRDAEEKLQESLNKEFADYISEIKDKDGKSPIILAAEKGNSEIVEYLIEIGCDVNQQDNNEKSLLMYAEENCSIETVEFLLKHHKDVTCISDEFYGDVYFFYNNRDCLDLLQISLIGKDKELEYRNIFQLSAYEVSSNEYIETLKAVIRWANRFYFNPEEPNTTMKSAIYNSKLTFAVFLNYENELYAMNELGSTSLMKAAEMNAPYLAKAIEIERELLEKRIIEHSTLKNAVRKGSLDIVKCLIKHGADVNAKNKYGYTALMEAARCHSPEIMKYLIENGADVNKQYFLTERYFENYGKPETALDMALDSYKSKHSPKAMKCIEILMKAGAAFDPKKIEQIRGDKNFEYFINKFDLENSNEEMKALRMIKEEKKDLDNVSHQQLINVKNEIVQKINNNKLNLSDLQKELSDKRTDKFFILRDLGVDIEGLEIIQLEKLAKSGSKIIKKGLEEKKDHNTIKEELAKQLVIKREMIKIRSQNANQREQTKSWVEKITSGVGKMLRSGKSK